MLIREVIVEHETQLYELPSTQAIMRGRKQQPKAPGQKVVQSTGRSGEGWWNTFANWTGKVISSIAADVTGGAIGQHYRGKRDDKGNFIPGTAPDEVASIMEPPAPAKTRTLRRGSRGADVKAMQKAMNLMGFDTGNPDGAFGPGTEKAVKAMQSKLGLKPDGLVGPGTRKAMTQAHHGKALNKAQKAKLAAAKKAGTVDKFGTSDKGPESNILQIKSKKVSDDIFGKGAKDAKAFQVSSATMQKIKQVLPNDNAAQKSAVQELLRSRALGTKIFQVSGQNGERLVLKKDIDY